VSRRVLGVGAALLFAAVLTAYGVGGMLRIRAMQREIDATERDLATLKAQAERLSTTIDRLRNDPAYIEKLGREEHGLVREGETVLKFPPKSK
jgi:cell division protein FtsB